MLYMLNCTDKPNREMLRIDTRQAHLDYLSRYKDRVFAVGPLTNDDGSEMIGSLLILDFDNRAAAEAFAADDPYAKSGLFEAVVIRRWKKVLPSD